MSDLIDRAAVQREIQNSFNAGAFRWQDGQDLMDRINALPAAPRWHRVEEPPKEDGWYMLCYLSRWKNGSWWIPDYPDYWTEPPREGE